MHAIDRFAIEQLGIPRVLLMTLAGLAVANAVTREAPPRSRVVVLCGSGYNGGDGLCAAWHLHRFGYRPDVILADAQNRLREEPACFATILNRLGVPMASLTSTAHIRTLTSRLRASAIVIDALLGIGLRGPVRPLHTQWIEAMNAGRRPIIAADIPSGLDGDTGRPHGLAVRAKTTVTFGAAKAGLLKPHAAEYVGALVVEDIGLPVQLALRRTA